MPDSTASEAFDRDADMARSGRKLATHSINTVFEMAKDAGASPDTVAQMLSNMAEAHRAAAGVLDRAALAAKLRIKQGRKGVRG